MRQIFNRINNYLDSHKSIGIFLLRLFIGLRLIYGVVDNIFSWKKMLEFSAFLESNGFPFPVVNAVLSVYVQFFGAILLIIGYKARLAAFILAINFFIAIGIHISFNDSIEGMTPAMAIFFSCLALLFIGPGKIAVSGKSEV